MNELKTIEVIELHELSEEVLEALNDNWTPIGGVFQPEGDDTLCMLLTRPVNP